MAFGERLKQLRTDKKMKQSELAKLLGVTNVAISHYESDSRNPDLETLGELSDIFNVSVDDLLGVPPKNERDLKSLFKSGAVTYGGDDVSMEDLEVIEQVVGAILTRKNDKSKNVNDR